MEGSQDKTDGKIEVKIIYNFEKYFLFSYGIEVASQVRSNGDEVDVPVK